MIKNSLRKPWQHRNKTTGTENNPLIGKFREASLCRVLWSDGKVVMLLHTEGARQRARALAVDRLPLEQTGEWSCKVEATHAGLKISTCHTNTYTQREKHDNYSDVSTEYAVLALALAHRTSIIATGRIRQSLTNKTSIYRRCSRTSTMRPEPSSIAGRQRIRTVWWKTIANVLVQMMLTNRVFFINEILPPAIRKSKRTQNDNKKTT